MKKKVFEAKDSEEVIEWHALDNKKTLELLNTNRKGLSNEEASKRIELYGKNELKGTDKVKPWLMFLQQFNSFFIYLLLIAILISAFLGHWIDFFVILAIILLNSFIGFFQNYRAEKAIENLKKSLVPKARVLRNNIIYEISASGVVPGDIIHLQEGDRVVADIRVIESRELRVNEAVLTGESLPISKIANEIKEETVLAERINMVYSGTSVVQGSGYGVVIATGMNTEFGKIASMVQEVKREKTPLQEKLDSFAKKIGIVAIILCLLIAVLGISLGMDKLQMFFTAVSIAVAAVPEGLPAVITICLAIAVKRMYKVNCLIRKLPAAETLGRVTVICSDKTGTMTKEEMNITDLFFNNKKFNEKQLGEEKSKEFEMLMKINCLCNNAKMNELYNRVEFMGDPTEQALLKIAYGSGFTKNELKKDNVIVKEFVFTSSRKMMSIVRENKNQRISYVKGAPEIILERCTHEMINNGIVELSKKRRQEVQEVYEDFSNKGLRVLGFAFKELKSKKDITEKDAESDLVFVGIQGMIDPPREEVVGAIKACQEAGIKIKMITGDSLITAKAVCAKIGLFGKAINGKDLEQMSEEELSQKIGDIVIFARTTPEQKLRIVALLKDKEEVVAVTGDGVNDAPALKKADIGVAMGVRGTDVSRDVSDIVLTDDNFASIVKAVGEGRRVFDNIKKFSFYLLSSNLAEIFIILFALLFGLKLGWPTALALIPIQILWINLITDGMVAISLSFEHAEPDVMQRKPEKAQFFTKGIVGLWFCLAVLITLGILACVAIIKPIDAIKLQTIIFTAMVFFENFNALNFRSFKQPLYKLKANWSLYGLLIVAFILQILILAIEPIQKIFGVTSLSLKEIGIIFGISLLLLVIGEIFTIAQNKILEKKKNH